MLRTLARTREGRVLVAAYAVAAVICAFLPLADHLGFELAFVLAFVGAIFAPAVGFAASRLEREQHAAARPARAAAWAGLFAVLALAAPATIILLNGVRRPACDPALGAAWLAVLAAPSAWLAATFGAAVRSIVASRRRAVATIVAAELTSLIANASSIYTGPVHFVHDHFFGYFPGPLYDEAIPFSAALLAFRAATVAWGGVAVAVAGAAGTADMVARRMHRAWAAAGILALLATTVVWGAALGWRSTDRSIARALGGRFESDGLIIHYPREWSDRTLAMFTRDAVFAATEVREALALTTARPVRIWVYRTPAEKRRLVGAEWTQFAKPWRREIHINAQFTVRHGSLRHELIHALAGELGPGPFAVAGGVIPNAALIEGIAEAYDIDDGTQTLAQRARAMREMGAAPDLHRILAPTGFLGEAPSRAYAYAGAFIRFLHQRVGGATVRRLYTAGDLAAIGNADSLVREFERMLDTVSVDADARALAARQFALPSIFGRRCAREVGRLENEAWELAAERQYDQAIRVFDRVCALQPENPALANDRLEVALRARFADFDRVWTLAQALWAHPAIDPILASNSRVSVGDDLWRRGDTARAHMLYRDASGIAAGAAAHRAAVTRLRVLPSPTLAPLLARFLTVDRTTGTILRLWDAARQHPNEPLLLYVLGREVEANVASGEGAELLARAAKLGLDDVELTREAWRSATRGYAVQHRCDDAAGAREGLRSSGGTAADLATADDWVARCRFAIVRGWAPVTP